MSFHVNKSATVCHGLWRIQWLILSTLTFTGLSPRQMGYWNIMSRICLYIPGCNMIAQPLCLHFSMPALPVWTCNSISALKEWGFYRRFIIFWGHLYQVVLLVWFFLALQAVLLAPTPFWFPVLPLSQVNCHNRLYTCISKPSLRPSSLQSCNSLETAFATGLFLPGLEDLKCHTSVADWSLSFA